MASAGQPLPAPDPSAFFSCPGNSRQRRYEILRAFYFERLPAKDVAARFGCSASAVYAITRDFRKLKDPSAYFFRGPAPPGRPRSIPADDLRKQVIDLRKLNLSLPDIKARLDARSSRTLSERAISRILKEEGFARLPRRTRAQRSASTGSMQRAPEPIPLPCQASESFEVEGTGGILCFLPWIRRYGIDKAIEEAGYPSFDKVSPLQAVLSILALKLSHIGRYSSDDLWCMDRGLGLFAGLNVLPNGAWVSSYSKRTTAAMNRRLLGALSRSWTDRDLVGDSANLDFVAIPHWGRDDTSERQSAETRSLSLANLSVALAQDPASGLLLHSASSAHRRSGHDSLLKLIDSFHTGGFKPRHLVFDGRFTSYAGLKLLDEKGIPFLTARRRGHNLVEGAKAISKDNRMTIRVSVRNGTCQLEVAESKVPLRGYDGDVRQITLLRGSRQPTLLITNDFDASLPDIFDHYARRWLVEKPISDPLAFFHLNRPSSSMRVKVDFDFALTVVAFNLYHLLARDLPRGFQHRTPQTVFKTLLGTGANIHLDGDSCSVSLKRKRNLPILLDAVNKVSSEPVPWLGNRRVTFDDATPTRTPDLPHSKLGTILDGEGH